MPLYGVFCHKCGKLLGSVDTGDKPHLEHSGEFGTVTIDAGAIESLCLKCAEERDGQDT